MSAKFTSPQSLSMKHVFITAPFTPICVNSMSSGLASSFIRCNTVMYVFSNVMNGNIQNVLFSISNLTTSSITVRCFFSGVRLFMVQLCRWNMSWLPGNTTHCCSYFSLVSSKKLCDADRTSISRYLLSWYRSPSTITVSISDSLQYSLITRHAYRMSVSLPGTPKWMSAVITILLMFFLLLI